MWIFFETIQPEEFEKTICSKWPECFRLCIKHNGRYFEMNRECGQIMKTKSNIFCICNIWLINKVCLPVGSPQTCFQGCHIKNFKMCYIEKDFKKIEMCHYVPHQIIALNVGNMLLFNRLQVSSFSLDNLLIFLSYVVISIKNRSSIIFNWLVGKESIFFRSWNFNHRFSITQYWNDQMIDFFQFFFLFFPNFFFLFLFFYQWICQVATCNIGKATRKMSLSFFYIFIVTVTDCIAWSIFWDWLINFF